PRIASSASCGLSSASSISTCSNSSMLYLLRKREVERRALVGCAVRPHAAVVAHHDSLHEREPDAGAREFRPIVQPLEHTEQLVPIARVEPGAIVAHVEDVLALLADRPDLDDRLILLRGELDRVRQQVDPNL